MLSFNLKYISILNLFTIDTDFDLVKNKTKNKIADWDFQKKDYKIINLQNIDDPDKARGSTNNFVIESPNIYGVIVFLNPAALPKQQKNYK